MRHLVCEQAIAAGRPRLELTRTERDVAPDRECPGIDRGRGLSGCRIRVHANAGQIRPERALELRALGIGKGGAALLGKLFGQRGFSGNGSRVDILTSPDAPDPMLVLARHTACVTGPDRRPDATDPTEPTSPRSHIS
jgi:hypothetical protein